MTPVTPLALGSGFGDEPTSAQNCEFVLGFEAEGKLESTGFYNNSLI
jgi:hypothetical protein